MTNHQITKAEASKVYTELRKIPLDQWMKADKASLGKAFSQNKIEGINVNQLGTSAKMFGRVAHAVDESVFVDSLINGELPPFKLTNEELEIVKGGLVPLAIYAIYGGCVLVGGVIGYFARPQRY